MDILRNQKKIAELARQMRTKSAPPPKPGLPKAPVIYGPKNPNFTVRSVAGKRRRKTFRRKR
jgi:hypothetical protein